MKNIAIIITFLSLGLSFTFGQTPNDTISIKKIFGGYKFYQGDQRVTMNQLVKAMKPNEQAYQQIKSAQSLYNITMVLNCAAGGMIGWTLGTATGGGEPNWTLAVAGVGLAIVAIPVSINFNNKVTQAAETYNLGLRTSSYRNKTEYNLLLTGYGIGFIISY